MMRSLMLLSVLLLSIPAAAAPAFAEWTAELYGGGSFTNKLTVTDASSRGFTASFERVKANGVGTIGGRLGYWFDEFADTNLALGIGLDVFSFGANLDQQTVPVQVGTIRTTGTLRAFDIPVIGISFDLIKLRLHLAKSEQFPQGQLRPYATLGPAIFKVSMQDTANFRPNHQSASDTAVGVKVGVGAQYLLTQNIGAFAEYRFTHFKADGSFQHLGPPASTETVSGNFDTHHLIAGLSVLFDLPSTLLEP